MKRIRPVGTLTSAILTVAVLVPSAFAQDQIEVEWEGLKYALEGKKVSTVLVDGTTLRGRVIDVSSSELHFDVKKTSDRDLYPKGERSVPRDQVTAFSYIERRGPRRAIGAAIGAAAGVAAFVVPVEIAVNESGGSRAVGYLVPGAIGAAIGYAAGRAGDRHEIMVVVAKEQ